MRGRTIVLWLAALAGGAGAGGGVMFPGAGVAMAHAPASPFLSMGAVTQPPRGFTEMCGAQPALCASFAGRGDGGAGGGAAPDADPPLSFLPGDGFTDTVSPPEGGRRVGMVSKRCGSSASPEMPLTACRDAWWPPGQPRHGLPVGPCPAAFRRMSVWPASRGTAIVCAVSCAPGWRARGCRRCHASLRPWLTRGLPADSALGGPLSVGATIHHPPRAWPPAVCDGWPG